MAEKKDDKKSDKKYKKEYKKMTGKSVKSAKKYYNTKVPTTSVGVGKVKAPKKKDANVALGMAGLALGGRAGRSSYKFVNKREPFYDIYDEGSGVFVEKLGTIRNTVGMRVNRAKALKIAKKRDEAKKSGNRSEQSKQQKKLNKVQQKYWNKSSKQINKLNKRIERGK